MDLEAQATALSSLNLTLNQAKIYLTLVNLTVATAKEISKTSKVARDEVYRAIPKLSELGLIEVIVDSPTKYKAQPIDEGIQNLQRLRNNEEEKTKKVIETLVKQYKAGPQISKIDDIENKCVLITGRAAELKTCQLTNEVAYSCDIISHLPRILRQMDTYVELNSKRVNAIETKRGKVFKSRLLIITDPKRKEQVTDYIKFSKKTEKKNLDCKIRMCSLNDHIDDVYIAIFDDKQFIIETKAPTDVKQSILYSDNPFLVKIVKGYFNGVWSKSEEYIL
ncbi:MAG: TrmB family transcriptional regulator [Candidatus Bathyarchaeia archaeon]|jgi:sugar-specific transcriptional regulator TrmB